MVAILSRSQYANMCYVNSRLEQFYGDMCILIGVVLKILSLDRRVMSLLPDT